jgi:hypothetical protein
LGSRRDRAFELIFYLIEHEKATLIEEVYIRLMWEDASKVDKTSMFCGRRVGMVRIDIGLMQAWLHECQKYHQFYQPRKSDAKKINDSNLFVIDVHQQCLVKVPRHSR